VHYMWHHQSGYARVNLSTGYNGVNCSSFIFRDASTGCTDYIPPGALSNPDWTSVYSIVLCAGAGSCPPLSRELVRSRYPHATHHRSLADIQRSDSLDDPLVIGINIPCPPSLTADRARPPAGAATKRRIESSCSKR
jgi:hypothetical protein